MLLYEHSVNVKVFLIQVGSNSHDRYSCLGIFFKNSNFYLCSLFALGANRPFTYKWNQARTPVILLGRFWQKKLSFYIT